MNWSKLGRQAARVRYRQIGRSVKGSRIAQELQVAGDAGQHSGGVFRFRSGTKVSPSFDDEDDKEMK